MPCVTDEKTEVQGGVMACLTSQSESVAQTGPPGLNSQPSARSSILIEHLDQLEEVCWKLLFKEIVGGSKARKLNIRPKCYRQGSVTCFSCIVFPLGCMSLGTTGQGKINLNLCLVHSVVERDSCPCDLIWGSAEEALLSQVIFPIRLLFQLSIAFSVGCLLTSPEEKILETVSSH